MKKILIGFLVVLLVMIITLVIFRGNRFVQTRIFIPVLYCLSAPDELKDGVDLGARFSVSPDGKNIIFDAVKNLKRNVYKINLANSQITQLTFTDNAKWPILSPDGKKIAFISNEDQYLIEDYDKREISIMDSDGSNQRKLTHNNFQEFFPHFSPDSSKIAFARTFIKSKHGRVCSILFINIDDGIEHEIDQFDFDSWHWDISAEFLDDKTIAFQYGTQVYFVDISASLPKVTTKIAYGNDEFLSDFQSPDGKKVVFIKFMEGKPNDEIFIADAGRKNQIQLVNNGLRNTPKGFTPDSKKVIFLSGKPDQTGGLELWQVDIDGSNLKRIDIKL